MVIIKRTDSTGNWIVYHRSASGDLYLNRNYPADPQHQFIGNTTPSTFSVDISASYLNTLGATYVAYLFAHDPSADGIIQCGSFTTDGSGNATVDLGWEPQYVMLKATTSAIDNWQVHDTARGTSVTNLALLLPNSSDAEINATGDYLKPTSIGFTLQNYSTSAPYIYLAIRRPNKPPTTGTQVYNAITYTGNGGTQTVTTPFNNLSLVISKALNSGAGASSTQLTDRLRGLNNYLLADSTATEYNTTGAIYVDSSKITYTYGSGAFVNQNAVSYINHFFRRAPGFFDVVCYTGTGVLGRTVAHNLNVQPEMIVVKRRDGAQDWNVYHSGIDILGSKILLLNTTQGVQNGDTWNAQLATNTVFYVGGGAGNVSTQTYVAYLFATLAGISKVGSYTGNGSSQTINCGFSTGSRFILIKRTDATGDWYVWDSVRGIIAANDPHLSLNTTAAEVTTDDSVDPDASGFIVNQNTATNINVNGGKYIFLAIA